MLTIMNTINFILPLLALVLILFGLMKRKTRFVVVSMLIAIIAIFIQYEVGGGELFGSYFDYNNAAMYTICFIVLITGLVFIAMTEKKLRPKCIKYPVALFFSLLIIGSVLVVTNVWINAFFIKDRLPGTPIVEVGYFEKLDYCANRFVYYKINNNHQVAYLCPNHYFLIARVGQLTVAPKILVDQLLLGKPPRPSVDSQEKK